MAEGSASAWARVRSTVRELWHETSSDAVSESAAALAYRFLLALFPFVIFLAALGAFMAGQLGMENPADEIVRRAGTALPADARSVVQDQLDQLLSDRQPGLLSFGILGALWAASSGIGATIRAMNRAYDIEEVRPFWKRTLLAIGLTLFSGLFFILAFVLAVAGDAIASALAGAVQMGGVYQAVVTVLRFAFMIVAVMVALALLYWAAPSVRPPFRWVTPGSVLFMALWLVASLAFGWYVSNFASYNATYGALGGVVVMMIFFYITAYLLLLGAELNAILHRRVQPETSPTEIARASAEAGQDGGEERSVPVPADGAVPARGREGMRTAGSRQRRRPARGGRRAPRRSGGGGMVIASLLAAAALWRVLGSKRAGASSD